jgi:uncharacterized protein (TIGR03790 family)
VKGLPKQKKMSDLRLLFLVIVCVGLTLARPAIALDRNHLAIIINTQDSLSIQIGEYYAQRRNILFQNIIKVSFTPGVTVLSRAEFERIKAEVDKKTMPYIQAYALTWTAPYRVECMSITTAFAFGFDPAFCANQCKPTRISGYFNSGTRLPFTQLGIRPAMVIAATSLDQAKALIDRGVESDATNPAGTMYQRAFGVLSNGRARNK